MQPQLPTVIGIAGKARSGKDTLAQFLVERHGYERRAYADPLKEMALKMDPYVFGTEQGIYRLSQVIEDFGWEVAKDRFPEARRTLQFLGTEVVRSVKPSHWIDLMDRFLMEKMYRGVSVVVPDVRFQNESQLIRDHGGIVVELVRAGVATAGSSHVSEQRIPGDLVLPNDGTPEDLYQAFIASI